MKTTAADAISTEQVAKVRSMKGLDSPSESKPCIAITHEDGTALGTLVPIDRALADDEQVVDKLTAWRQRFMEFFMTQFTATSDRTRNWLREVVLKDDTRVLFLIRDDTGSWVGNIGVCDLSSHTAEVDNVIRGARGGHARLIYYAELALMRWLFCELGVEAILLRVLFGNQRAIRLYQSVGFVQERTVPLGVEQTAGMTRYFTDPKPHDKRTELQLVEMAVDRHDFFARHAWLEE